MHIFSMTTFARTQYDASVLDVDNVFMHLQDQEIYEILTEKNTISKSRVANIMTFASICIKIKH